MSHLALFGSGFALLVVCMILLWLGSVLRKDASLIDSFWGLGFAFLATFFLAMQPTPPSLRSWLLLGLVWLWALRLSGYILWRSWGREEDYRYQAFRKAGGSGFWWKSFFTIFLLQATLLWLISSPLLLALSGPPSWTIFDTFGLLLWCIGFFFEAMADGQLARFKADPAHRGQLLTEGLWRYTRHPNYFGEAALWWGYFFFALSAPGGWQTLYSPILMTFLLLRVSGVALLEKGLKASKPGYEAYIARTSSFFPWPPSEGSQPPSI